MKLYEIENFAPVNDVNPEKVAKIADSIRRNGYVGMPILVASQSGILVTGSHRLAALEAVANEIDVDSIDVAEDVQDIIDKWCEENDSCIDDIDFSSIGNVFKDTWVEQYKNEMEEW